MRKSKPCNHLTTALLEDIDLFKKTVENTVFFDKEKTKQPNHKYSKFLNYNIVLDAKYSASDKLFYNSGINVKIIKQMQQGRIKLGASIDLHGQTLIESCLSLANFIYYHQTKDYLHIIHGKGYNANNMSKLKTQVAIYLTAHPQISAFCSATQNYGGTGAIFARLKH